MTPAEMKAVDAAAPEPIEVLVSRAGAAVARVARSLLGGTYGRRVVVVAGTGNNGADGRDAARRLRRAGVGVQVIEAADAPPTLPAADLVIDAAFGTGFRGTYQAPDPGAATVLAVDIPSGIDGLTGAESGQATRADVTVTFAALKPGLLLGIGARRCGEIQVADIGLDVSSATAGEVTDDDVVGWYPLRSAEAHKWVAATWVVGGAPSMPGAPALCAAAAMRTGASYVRWSVPGVPSSPHMPIEAVAWPVPATGWHREVIDSAEKVRSVVLGPGLGREPSVRTSVREVIAACEAPLVVDGDGLWALGDELVPRPDGRSLVLTPHDGEFAQLTGSPPGDDRLAAARALAARCRAVVLLKGPTTVVADPEGRVALVTSGDDRLATAGTGDVLAGMIGAWLARGTPAFEAAAGAAHLHGLVARSLPRHGLVAGDLVAAIPVVADGLLGGGRER